MVSDHGESLDTIGVVIRKYNKKSVGSFYEADGLLVVSRWVFVLDSDKFCKCFEHL